MVCEMFSVVDIPSNIFILARFQKYITGFHDINCDLDMLYNENMIQMIQLSLKACVHNMSRNI